MSVAKIEVPSLRNRPAGPAEGHITINNRIRDKKTCNLVPTLRVEMQSSTLRVVGVFRTKPVIATQSVGNCIPTRSVGTR